MKTTDASIDQCRGSIETTQSLGTASALERKAVRRSQPNTSYQGIGKKYCPLFVV